MHLLSSLTANKPRSKLKTDSKNCYSQHSLHWMHLSFGPAYRSVLKIPSARPKHSCWTCSDEGRGGGEDDDTDEEEEEEEQLEEDRCL